MTYQVGEFEINTSEYSIKKNGEIIAVEPKVFDVVVYLLANADRVITRQEFLDKLWPDTQVSDATLSNHIKFARAALGDNGNRQALIKTIHGRGYQFVGAFNETSSQTIVSANQSPGLTHDMNKYVRSKRVIITSTLLLLAVAYLLLTLPESIVSELTAPDSTLTEPKLSNSESQTLDKSIAILPFKVLNKVETDEYFMQGVHSELLSNLQKFRDLKTISKSAVSRYQNGSKSIKSIGEELSVAFVLVGDVQRVEQNIRVNVQLVDTKTEQQIWAQTYTSALSAKNIFDIQSELSFQIAKSLNIALTKNHQHGVTQLPTENLTALEFYFYGKAISSFGTRQDNEKAIEYLEKALQTDPQFALAYAQLARLELNQIHWAGAEVADQIARAKPLIAMALQYDNQLSEAYTALGVLNVFEQNYLNAEIAFKKSLALKPNNSDALVEYGNLLLWKLRRLQEAEQVFAQAVSLSPNDNLVKSHLISAHIDLGEFNRAQNEINALVSASPLFAPAYRVKADLYYWRGNSLVASQLALNENLRLAPNAPFNAMIMSHVYVLVGDYQSAIEWLQYSVAIAPNADNALLANAMIEHLKSNDNVAFEMFLQLPANQHVFPIYLYDLVEKGIGLGRLNEVKSHYQKFYPLLFSPDVKIDAANFIPAVAVARIMKASGEQENAEALLVKCLKVVSNAPFGGWTTRESDWQTRIYLALGNLDLAARSFAQYVSAGFGADSIITSPTYQPLLTYPQYAKALADMKRYLSDARQELNQLKAAGKITRPQLSTPNSPFPN